jgi:hypothetical protein
LASGLKHEKIPLDHDIFGKNDERIKGVTEALFTYALIAGQGLLKTRILESIENYQ